MASPRNQKPDKSVSRDSSLARLATAAESRADAFTAQGSYSNALDAAIQAAELYIQARREASTSTEKLRLDQQCSNVLAKAERWKKQQLLEAKSPTAPPSKRCDVAPASTPPPPSGPPRKRPTPRPTKAPTVKEQTLLLKSSKINGGVFPPWKEPLEASEFPKEPFSDPVGFLQLSDAQKSLLDAWKRPHEIYEDARILPEIGVAVDLTQDVVTDCSVVASLCACSRRAEMGFGVTCTEIIYPQDENGRAVVSPSGKYVVKLFFNGCYRKVIIDDYLPASNSGRALYVTCRKNPSVFAPALIEKAYLKIMGGYDFPGSNSGTDLLALTGWIPEHIFLQSDEIVFSTLWRRMLKAWGTGDVLVTLGTGRITIREEIELGLIGEHDYAVLEMKEEDGERMVLVKNPWSEGTVWKETAEGEEDDQWDEPSDNSTYCLDMSEVKGALPTREPLQPGVFWISLENICRNFASIYLNWNPTLFTHVHKSHFSWDLSTKTAETSFGRNPQYSISNPSQTPGPIWVLLSRHLGLPNTQHEGMIQNGFISLYLFDASGYRVYLSAPNLRRTPYVDSPQTLLCIDDFPGGETYTLVVSSQDLSPTTHSFSLAVYSLSTFHITPVKETYPYSLTLSSSWTEATAGGNAHSSAYPQNPQFVISLLTTTDLGLLLESRAEHPLHVKLVHAPCGRVARVTTRDIIAESGEYKRFTALATISSLPAGSYTIVASTFEAGQVGNFSLTLLSTSPSTTLRELPSETAGCFETVISGEWGSGRRKLVWPMDVGRLMGLWAKAQSKGAVRVSILKGKEVVAESSGGGFEDLPMGVRTARVDLEWRDGGYYVMLERQGTEGSVKWQVDVLSEGTLWVGEEEGVEDEDE